MAPARTLAKLTRPAAPAAHSRARLFERLNRPDAPPVVWITGPPGSGKSTLAADYAARRTAGCLWYQVDRGDADVASFFFYLSQAAREHGALDPLPRFEPAYLGDIEAFARGYFRELCHQLKSPFLVFDNCQDAGPEAALLAVLRAAVNELPEGSRLLVISRNAPPAGFVRLRARGRMEVIGWNDLRLTLEEARSIARARDVSLPDAELQRLHERTQGWAAGLILLLQTHGADPGTSAGAAAETPAVIFDYLAEEFFQQFKPDVRESLLRLGYLPQITESMLEGLGVSADARRELGALASGQFLVTTIAAGPTPVFQLHRLLCDFLQARAEQTGTPAEQIERKRLAADVLAAHEHFGAACALRIGLGDWQQLAELIRARAETLLRQGRGQTLERWISALPESIRGTDPWLLIWLGHSRFPYAPAAARDLFARAYELASAAQPPAIDAVLAAINGGLEATLNDPEQFALFDPWIEAATRWTQELDHWPSADLEARLSSNMCLALTMRQPWHPDARRWKNLAERVSQTHADPNVRLGINAVLIIIAAWTGHFSAAETMIELMREIAQAPQVTAVTATKFAQAQAIFFMLSGDRERCLEAAELGLRISGESGVRLWSDTFPVNRLLGALGAGDLELAAQFIRELEARPPTQRPFDAFLHVYGLAWYAMLRGDGFLAHQQLKNAVKLAGALGAPFLEASGCLALAQTLLRSGDAAGAQRELARAIEIGARLKNRLLDLMTLLSRAHLALEGGERGPALELLREGFAIARRRRIMHVLWLEPRQLARLCQLALEANIEPDFVRHLISQRRLLPDPPPYGLSGWPWHCRVRVLGSFQLETAESPRPAKTRGGGRPRELLQALVALGGEHVKLERLAATLWPRIDKDYQQRSLNTTLHRLRALPGMDSIIVVEGGEASLDRRLVWTDVWAFASACEEMRALGTSADRKAPPDELLRLTRLALGYYRGPLLAGETKTAWVKRLRDEYRDTLVRTVTTAAQAAERAGQIDAAIDLYARGCACEPASEPLCYRLMLLLNRIDRVSEAIEAYQRHRIACRGEAEDDDEPPGDRVPKAPSTQMRDLHRLLQSRLSPETLESAAPE
ncbi:MAG TPA: BTAD domain-containing putative transcriptional regulator [Steroidobacteraceae bacterium]|nr:BTAD domain-containing putative transcriptional regulator [Steroidobacteraceae bacterium]